MAFCSYCGCQVGSSDRFCPNCGATLTDAVNTQTSTAQTSSTQSSAQTTYTNTFNQSYTGSDDGRTDYEVVLSGLGSCASSTCNDLLEDLLGYTDNQASLLIANIPVKIGDNMTYTQAQTVAQALTEYGALISVINGNGNVDVSSSATTSLFNTDGSFIKKALAVLATITIANRVTSYTSYRKPSLLERIFKLPFFRKDPPKHMRRTIPRKIYVRPQNFRYDEPGPEFRAQYSRPPRVKAQQALPKQPRDHSNQNLFGKSRSGQKPLGQRPYGQRPGGTSTRGGQRPDGHGDHRGPGRH